MQQSNKFSFILFILCLGLFTFLSMESMGLSHFINKPTVTSKITVAEPQYISNVMNDSSVFIFRRSMILPWFHNLGICRYLYYLSNSYERVFFLPFWLERWQGYFYTFCIV